MSVFRIACPQCHHEHDVPTHHFTKESRLLKCAQCEHVWRHYLTPAPVEEQTKRETPPVVKDQPPQQMPRKKIKTLSPQPSQSYSPPQNERNIESFPPLPPSLPPVEKRRYRETVHHYHLDWWLLLIACIIAGIVIVREIGSVPNLSWLYNQTHTLISSVLRSLHFSKEEIKKVDPHSSELSLNILTSHLSLNPEGEPVITIKGEIINNTQEMQDSPGILIRLMDKEDNGSELIERHSWSYTLDKGPLKPGEHTVFETTGPCKKNTQPEAIQLDFEN